MKKVLSSKLKNLFGFALVILVIPSFAATQENPEAFTKIAEKGYYPAWTPDGSAIVYGSMGREVYNVWVVTLRDRTTRKLTEKGGFHPAVSPDGAFITYDNRGAFGRIFKIPVGGGDPVRITPENMTGNFSCWSPDGTSLLFTSGGDIWGVPAEGGEAVSVVARDAFDTRPAISPDGDKIAFDSAEGGQRNNFDVWIFDTVKKTYARLTDDSGKDIQAHWSPDGTMIAYTSEKSGNKDIWVVRVADKAAVQVTRYEGIDVWPRWSPDGKKIAFGSDRGGSTDIWVVDLERWLGKKFFD